MKHLIDKLDSYGFECEAGTMENCVDWVALKNLVSVAEDIVDEAANSSKTQRMKILLCDYASKRP